MTYMEGRGGSGNEVLTLLELCEKGPRPVGFDKLASLSSRGEVPASEPGSAGSVTVPALPLGRRWARPITLSALSTSVAVGREIVTEEIEHGCGDPGYKTGDLHSLQLQNDEEASEDGLGAMHGRNGSENNGKIPMSKVVCAPCI